MGRWAPSDTLDIAGPQGARASNSPLDEHGGGTVPTHDWGEVATYPDRISAELVLGLLAQGGVPGRIVSDEHLPGLGLFFSVVVPAELLHHAQSLLSEPQVSESELTDLATKKLPDGANEG